MEKETPLEMGLETLVVGVSAEDLKRPDHVRVLRQWVTRQLGRIQWRFEHQQNPVPLVGRKFSQTSHRGSPYYGSLEYRLYRLEVVTFC